VATLNQRVGRRTLASVTIASGRRRGSRGDDVASTAQTGAWSSFDNDAVRLVSH